MDKLEFTGERLIPGVNGQIAIDHLHRYSIAYPLVSEKVVLDIACGEGYGAKLLSEVANQVVGVDISEETIKYAEKKYSSKNLEFKVGSADEIPFEDNFFDVVVSFETIEHLENHEGMISEIKRVLKDDGLLIISSPNKTEYSEAINYSNPFHEKELDEKEFRDLTKKFFSNVILTYQSPLLGSIIFDDTIKKEKRFNIVSGDFNSFNFDFQIKPKYFVILASNFKLDKSNFNSIYAGNDLFNFEFSRIKNMEIKFKKSYRYRLINFLFKPYDFFKKVIKK
jgi:ubiquinone/menaquinone biosynthesis C-methylase UbiE